MVDHFNPAYVFAFKYNMWGEGGYIEIARLLNNSANVGILVAHLVRAWGGGLPLDTYNYLILSPNTSEGIRGRRCNDFGNTSSFRGVKLVRACPLPYHDNGLPSSSPPSPPPQVFPRFVF